MRIADSPIAVLNWDLAYSEPSKAGSYGEFSPEAILQHSDIIDYRFDNVAVHQSEATINVIQIQVKQKVNQPVKAFRQNNPVGAFPSVDLWPMIMS